MLDDVLAELESANPGEYDDEAFETEHAAEDECVVFKCTLCEKTRAVFGILSRDVCNVVDIRCADYGRLCTQDADPVPRRAKVFEPEVAEQPGESYQTQSLSNSTAWKHHPELAEKAAKKEFAKYTSAGAVEFETVEDWRRVKQEEEE